MGFRKVKRLRIGYVPNSKDLSAPGDRRRTVFWAKSRGHEIVTNLNEKVDILVLSERSDFGSFSNTKHDIPIIFDLVDGYLARESSSKDWLRGTSKVLAGQLSGIPRPFTHFVQDLCTSATAVICSSSEQKELIEKYSKNIHVILDSHDEIPALPFTGNPHSPKNARSLLWEGLPVTLGGISDISAALLRENSINSTQINFVTDLQYYRLLGKYLPQSTKSLLHKYLNQMIRDVKLIPWSVDNLVSTAKSSSAAIIPVVLSNPLQILKPENRLLIMWKLGLPTLASATPAYARVSRESGLDITCNTNADWEKKLDLLFKDSDYAEETVRCGQKYLMENHTSEILLLKWDQAIQSVL